MAKYYIRLEVGDRRLFSRGGNGRWVKHEWEKQTSRIKTGLNPDFDMSAVHIGEKCSLTLMKRTSSRNRVVRDEVHFEKFPKKKKPLIIDYFGEVSSVGDIFDEEVIVKLSSEVGTGE